MEKILYFYWVQQSPCFEAQEGVQRKGEYLPRLAAVSDHQRRWVTLTLLSTLVLGQE